jgi:hypothetical protein
LTQTQTQNKKHNKTQPTMDEVGALVSIFGIASPSLGCTCEHHAVCGTVVHLDMLVRLKTVTVEAGKSSLCCVKINEKYSLTQFHFVR